VTWEHIIFFYFDSIILPICPNFFGHFLILIQITFPIIPRSVCDFIETLLGSVYTECEATWSTAKVFVYVIDEKRSNNKCSLLNFFLAGNWFGDLNFFVGEKVINISFRFSLMKFSTYQNFHFVCAMHPA